MRLVKNGFIALLLPLLVACQKEVKLPNGFETEVENIKASYVPDKRLKVLNIVYLRDENKWSINAETTEPAAKSALEAIITKYFDAAEVRIDIQLLPHPDLKDSIYALVNISVGNLKKTPDHAAELVDQVLMGTAVKILKRQGGWFLIQAPYEYLGWITRGSLRRSDLQSIYNWEQQERIILDVNYTQIYSQPEVNSPVICDAVLGCILAKNGKAGSWSPVKLPDGREGYVESRFFKPYLGIDNIQHPDREKISARALKMMGIPYLWGGNSTKGFDCSGFSGTVYRSEGYQLPRDANMQVLVGEEVRPDSNFTNILAGDLLFFGSEKKISHVAISLGGNNFMHSHASSCVRINSLDKNDKLYDEFEKKRLKVIKRIITE